MVFDFLFNIRQNASSYVHLNEKNIKLQKEFFYELFRNNKENNIKNESVELLLDVNEMTKILFENGIQIQENTFINQDNNNKIIFITFVKNRAKIVLLHCYYFLINIIKCFYQKCYK